MINSIKMSIAGFVFLFNPLLSYCESIVPDFSITSLKSDTSGYVTVSGIVVDEKGDAIPNVMITIAGTYRNGRNTLSDGTFEIQVPNNQKFYLYFERVNYLKNQVSITSYIDIHGLRVELNESICHLDLIKGKVSCPSEQLRCDLPNPVFKEKEVELMMINIDRSKAEMAGGEEYWIPRFNRQKSAVLYEMGSSGKKLHGRYQGSFIVDKDGVVKKLALEGTKNTKVAEILLEIFQRTGKWGPARNGGPVASKFTFTVELP